VVEYVPPNQTVNQQLSILETTFVESQLHLAQGNALTLKVILVHQFSARKQIPMLKHTLYLPDLALFDFPKIEKVTQRNTFSVI
jgi:hypothetical protein